MIFRIQLVKHKLSLKDEICAAIKVGSSARDEYFTSICYGWGKTQSEAVKNLIYKFRQVRNSSRIARKKELMDTQKIPAFVNQPTTPLDPAIKAQLDAEIAKVRELIHSADRVLIASHILEIDKEAVSKLEDSRRNATISLIHLVPKDEK